MSDCLCYPCGSPAYGHPVYAHGAACYGGTFIEEYHPECPVGDHREMARRQFPGDTA